ncbi:unnamed protein product [Cylicocyclus nassatus]|uniref:Mur ligase N-terminal catalytic domain-containing protein n=1 Tax=Cylicocyclus nassatus TaxID=53992 RepID=A0AA36M6A1_CYLNA|nr:unnamed protein product [Cylicocyclus nassatus]
MIAARGYELGQIQQSAAKLEMENAQLQIEIAKLKSPQRIKDLAAQDFGMSIPTQIADIQHDSRKVTKGTLFVCMVGAHVDGHSFIPQARERELLPY